MFELYIFTHPGYSRISWSNSSGQVLEPAVWLYEGKGPKLALHAR